MTKRPTRRTSARRVCASGCAALALVAAGCSSGSTTGAPDPAGTACSYPDSGDAARPVDRPASLDVPDAGTVPVTLRTTAGAIDLTLSRDDAPCTVHSFLSLARQSYFVDTPCHRLTAPPAPVSLLQCGDPTGTGAGGPGYAVPDEPPTGLTPAEDARLGDPGTGNGGGDAVQPVIYPRGTVALANHGVPDSGGSQFFLAYRDSPLPPSYSIFGHVAPEGLSVLDAIADAGTDNAASPGDGHPNTPVTLKAVVLPRP